MLPVAKAMVYEVSLTLFGIGVLGLIQLLTGTFISWMIWVYSIVTVLLGFVDHAVVGWKKLNFECQWRRLLINFLLCVPIGMIYHRILFWLIPALNVGTFLETLASVKRLYEMYSYYSPFIYTFLFVLFNLCVLSGVRFFTNVGYLIFMTADHAFEITHS